MKRRWCQQFVSTYRPDGTCEETQSRPRIRLGHRASQNRGGRLLSTTLLQSPCLSWSWMPSHKRDQWSLRITRDISVFNQANSWWLAGAKRTPSREHTSKHTNRNKTHTRGRQLASLLRTRAQHYYFTVTILVTQYLTYRKNPNM